MNHDDERDHAEEAANRAVLTDGDAPIELSARERASVAMLAALEAMNAADEDPRHDAGQYAIAAATIAVAEAVLYAGQLLNVMLGALTGKKGD